VNYPEDDKPAKTVAIEDLGYIVLEHPQITITNALIMKLVQNKTAIVTCDRQHLPCSVLQPLVGHTHQAERYKAQLTARLPLTKQLWQQTVTSKSITRPGT
jgi:CRISPR-associated protein Cas1